MKHIKPGDILIWENWLSVVENGVTKEFLDNTPGLINIYNTKAKADGREVLYSVYRLK